MAFPARPRGLAPGTGGNVGPIANRRPLGDQTASPKRVSPARSRAAGWWPPFQVDDEVLSNQRRPSGILAGGRKVEVLEDMLSIRIPTPRPHLSPVAPSEQSDRSATLAAALESPTSQFCSLGLCEGVLPKPLENKGFIARTRGRPHPNRPAIGAKLPREKRPKTQARLENRVLDSVPRRSGHEDDRSGRPP